MHFSSRLHFAEAHRLNRMQFKCNLLPNSFITSALLMSTLRWPVANGNASHTAQAIISLFAAISLTFQSFQLHFTVHFFYTKKNLFLRPIHSFFNLKTGPPKPVSKIHKLKKTTNRNTFSTTKAEIVPEIRFVVVSARVQRSRSRTALPSQ